MKHKFASMVLCVCLILSTLQISASAENVVPGQDTVSGNNSSVDENIVLTGSSNGKVQPFKAEQTIGPKEQEGEGAGTQGESVSPPPAEADSSTKTDNSVTSHSNTKSDSNTTSGSSPGPDNSAASDGNTASDSGTEPDNSVTSGSSTASGNGTENTTSSPKKEEDTSTALSEASGTLDTPDASSVSSGDMKDTEETKEQEELLCSCKDKCSQDKVNADCPICTLPDADLAACTGKPVKKVVAATVRAAVAVDTIYVGTTKGVENGSITNPYGDLATAVAKAPSGATIILMDGAFCNDENVGGLGTNNPLVFDKPLTIQGQNTGVTLYSRRGGYVLGADVTLKNFNFEYTNIETNGIFANGHTLIIENVGNSASQNVDIYAGGLGATGSYAGSESVAGSGSLVKIMGTNSTTQLGTIYGGGYKQIWSGSSTIEVTGTAAIDGIKGFGKADKNTAQIVTGTVKISLTDVRVKSVDGMLNNTLAVPTMAEVEVTGTGNLNDSLSLTNIGKLTVVKGEFMPSP